MKSVTGVEVGEAGLGRVGEWNMSKELCGFIITVQLNVTLRVLLFSQVGSTSVQPAEKQVLFRSVPLNMPSVRTSVLHNTGQNHAYYQVPTHTLLFLHTKQET